MKKNQEHVLSPKQRAFNIFLAVVLCLGLTPITALGEANDQTTNLEAEQVAENSSESNTDQQSAVSDTENSFESTDNAASNDKQNAPSDSQATETESPETPTDPAENKTEADESAASVEQPKPLYVELYGDGLNAGDIYTFDLQKKENGAWVNVKEIQIKSGENQNNKFEGIEDGTYRFVYKGSEHKISEKSKVAIDKQPSVEFASEDGFAYESLKETTITLTMEPVEQDGSEETQPGTETGGNTENKGEDGLHADEEAVTDVLVRVEGEAEVTLTLPEDETITIKANQEQKVSGKTGTWMLLSGKTQSATDVSIETTNIAGIEIEHSDSFTGVTEFSKEVSFAGENKVVTIKVGTTGKTDISAANNLMMMSKMARSSSNPYVGEQFTGYGRVSYVSGGNGHTVNYVNLDVTSGILTELGTVTAYCVDHGRAAPVVGGIWSYTATVTGINYNTGQVDLSITWYGTGDYIYQDGYQSLYRTLSIWRSFGGYIDLQKYSADPDVTDGNDCYASFEGVEYGVYANTADAEADNNRLETLTLNADGYAKSKWYNVGTYYVKEVTPPEKGYEIDNTVYAVHVQNGTVRVNGSGGVKDTPLSDPAYAFAGKIDKETTQNLPQGSASLAGAEFTVKYYDGQYSTVEEAEASGEPLRTWIVATNEGGYTELSDDFLVGGDPLFKTSAGNPTIPLGTIVLQETKAPTGYLLNDQIFIQQITEDGIDGGAAVVYNAPEVPEQVVRGGISITKQLEGGNNEELEGIGFFIYNSAGEKMTFENASGEMVDELFLDANGFASTSEDALVYDTYTIVEDEATVPDNIILYKDSLGSGSMEVGKQDVFENHVIYDQEVTNYEKPDFDLIKVDGDSLDDVGLEQDADKVQDSEWALTYKEADGTWTEIERLVTNEQGRIDFSDQALSKFGTYRLTETKPAGVDTDDGYMWPEESYDAPYVEFVIDQDTYKKFEEGTYEGVAGDSWEYKIVDGTPALVHTNENWHYRDIQVEKHDQDTGAPVGNTKFSLWRYIGLGEPQEYLESQTRPGHDVYTEDPSTDIDTTRWEKVDEGLTNDNGTLLFRGLTFGYYMTVEECPDTSMAEWWESDGSTWDKYYFKVDEAEQKQVQVYNNLKINLETTVDKSTIERTSAGFVSLPGQVVDYNNVNVEEYKYDVNFTNGATNVRADQYTVIDNCEFVTKGIRLTKLWTPIVTSDTNGTYNIWYQTNMTDPDTVYSDVSATADNPENQLADGTDRISTVGWKLWKQDVSTSNREQLNVDDLGLADGEFITGLMLEFGSVDTGLKTTTPLTYLVKATEPLSVVNGADDIIIPNSAESHITRNWHNGDGLKDDAEDRVETRVIPTMSFNPTSSTWTGDSGSWSNGGHGLSKTSDQFPWWIVVVVGGVVIVAAGGVFYARHRMKALDSNNGVNNESQDN